MIRGYLLDTHSLIWWWTDPARLGAAAREAIETETQPIFVSIASVWEIAIKDGSGKLRVIEDFRRDYPVLMTRDGFVPLAIHAEHALKAGYMENDHRDPFDRLLAAQALIEGLTVITRDRKIAAFGCETLW